MYNGTIRGSVRFSLGRCNTTEEIDTATAQVVESVRALRAASASVAPPR